MDKNKKQTEWELNKNIIGLCKKCSDEKREKWQKQNKKLRVLVGDFAKIAITDENGTEHLWFEVIAVNKVCPTCKSDDVYESALNPDYNFRCNGCGDYFAEFIGRCDNTPVVIEKLKYDDVTIFKFKDIEEYLKK